MPYEKEKDVIHQDLKIKDSSIHVQLVQYDNGQKKISILNEFKNKAGEKRFSSKIGRIPIDLAEKTAKVILKIVKEIKN